MVLRVVVLVIERLSVLNVSPPGGTVTLMLLLVERSHMREEGLSSA